MKSLLVAIPLLLIVDAAAAAPLALDEGNSAFEAQVAQRYPLGATFTEAKADLEANGFRCSPFGGGGDAPTQECTRSTRQGECAREWAVELRERDGALRTPARGSVARLCAGAVLPGKPDWAKQQGK